MDCSTPGFPVHHQLPELDQTHVHWVNDAIQPSHPLSSPSPPAFNLSQHQGLFKWVSFLHQVAKVLEFQLQHQSGLISFRMGWLHHLEVQGTLKSLLKHHFKSINFSPLSFLYSPTLTSISHFSSVTQSCMTLCDPMDCSMPGLPVHRQLSEFTITHVHCVSDAIQPSHPLSSPSPPAFNLSQHQGFFKWVSFLHQVAKVLECQL